jgi:dTDP-4-dehydrorhamnose 3,5-epimerase
MFGGLRGGPNNKKKLDRYFFVSGQIKLVLYDNRPDSPSYRMINQLYFGEINRALVSVPPGIFHAVENTGDTEAMLFNIPSEAYAHENPDKHTLPIENDLIPYRFSNSTGY